MSAGPAPAQVRLADLEGESRTTSSLLASLATRLGLLHVTTGGAAVGSLMAGMAALGREASRTADGARLRAAIENGRPGMNGAVIWSALKIDAWLALSPPSPVLDHLRNDMALLLANDLDAALEGLPRPGAAAGVHAVDTEQAATFVDCVIGLWAFSSELVRAVEALAGPTAVAAGTFTVPADDGAAPGRSLLR